MDGVLLKQILVSKFLVDLSDFFIKVRCAFIERVLVIEFLLLVKLLPQLVQVSDLLSRSLPTGVFLAPIRHLELVFVLVGGVLEGLDGRRWLVVVLLGTGADVVFRGALDEVVVEVGLFGALVSAGRGLFLSLSSALTSLNALFLVQQCVVKLLHFFVSLAFGHFLRKDRRGHRLPTGTGAVREVGAALGQLGRVCDAVVDSFGSVERTLAVILQFLLHLTKILLVALLLLETLEESVH